jgi:hypothetical protein
MLLLFTYFSDSSTYIYVVINYIGVLFITDVFQNFRKGDEFFCFLGQSTQAVTGMFNLYRASQVVFPGEKILEDAKQFAFNFLREKQAANELFDKWIIMKDLPSEVYIYIYIYIYIYTYIYIYGRSIDAFKFRKVCIYIYNNKQYYNNR